MKNILEYLSTNINKEKIEKIKLTNDLKIPQDIIDKFQFKRRELKTGNVELISNIAKYNNEKLGVRFVFYLITKNKKYCLRRQYAVDANNWSNPPINMGEFNTVQDMCEYFIKWVEKKLVK